MGNYHEEAQKYITGAKKLGMKVKAEGSELIAYPKGYKGKPTGSKLGVIGQGVLDAVNKHVNDIKARDIVKKNAVIEAEKIFMKNKSNAMMDGSFPKVTGQNINSPYGKEAMRVQKQVVKTRLRNINK